MQNYSQSCFVILQRTTLENIACVCTETVKELKKATTVSKHEDQIAFETVTLLPQNASRSKFGDILLQFL